MAAVAAVAKRKEPPCGPPAFGSKRRRPEAWEGAEAPTGPDAQVIARVVEAVEKVASLNSTPVPEDADELRDFRSSARPPFSLASYVARLVHYLEAWKLEDNVLEPTEIGLRSIVLALVYLERLYRLRPRARLCPLTMHRLIATGMLLATKFVEDRPLSNRFWAQVAGISLAELNALEERMCTLLQFQLYVQQEEFQRCLEELRAAFGGAAGSG